MKKGTFATNQLLYIMLAVIILLILVVFYTSIGDKIIEEVQKIKIPQVEYE